MISNWNKVDLHLHSYESNTIKRNDFQLPYKKIDGENLLLDNSERYLKALFEKIKNDGLNIFSITDHNTINFEVYEKLRNDYKQELERLNTNFICGIEVDIHDEFISKPFHMLIIFSEYNSEKLKKFISEFHNKKVDINTGKVAIDETTNWTLNEVFSSMYSADVGEFMLIPHYNHKDKKIKVGELIKLKRPLTIFSAFEDGNNFTNLEKSIQLYLKQGITDFPTVAFSDWHNEPGENKISCTNLLGNNKFPFNTLKLAFNDAEMRVSLDNVKSTRQITAEREYIKEIIIGDKIIELSPNQNTLIGGFGSGKSFLGTVLLGRQEIILEKYSEFNAQVEKIKFKLNSGVEFSNLKDYKATQKQKLNLIELKQGNALYTCNEITPTIKSTLKDEIQVEFPKLDTSYSKDYEKLYARAETIGKTINDIKFKSNTEDSIQCELLANDAEFPIITNSEKEVVDNTEKFKMKTELVEGIENYESVKLFANICLFEENYFQNLSQELAKKIGEGEKTIELVKAEFQLIDEELNKYILDIQQKTKGKAQQVQRLSAIENSLAQYAENIKKFAKEINGYEAFYSSEKIKEELLKTDTIKISPSFRARTSYKSKEVNNPLKNSILKQAYRSKETLYEGILCTVLDEEKFHNNSSLKKLLSDYTEGTSILFNCKYDILNEADESIMSKSPGGRAIMLMEILLEKVDQINDGKLNILFIDQPEDQLDNKNIYKKIVKKVRENKRTNKNIQIFFISHNANISITSDSENVIIAKKNGNSFEYTGGGLEGDTHVKDIADILEGGLEALEQRGMKLNVKYYKEKWS